MSEERDQPPLTFTRRGQPSAAPPGDDAAPPTFTRGETPDPAVIPSPRRGPQTRPPDRTPPPSGYLAESWEALKPAPGEIVRGAGDFLGNFWRYLVTTDPQERTQTAGELLSKVGDVAQFATGARFDAPPAMAPPGATIPRAPGVRAPGFMTSPEGQAQYGQFRESGITPTPAIAGGPAAQRFGRQLQRVPFMGPRIEEASGTAREQAQTRLEELAAQQAGTTAMTQEQAGAMTRNAIKRFAADRTQAATDYNRFYSLMQGATPTEMPRTLAELNRLHGRFPNAPELEGLFTNPKFGQMRRALEPRTETIPGAPAQTSRILDPSGRPAVVTPATPATILTRPGTLSVQEIKELQSQIGYLIEDSSFGPESIPKAQLRRLYGALSTDLRSAATARGRPALQALERATAQYSQRMNIMERLEPIIKADSATPVYQRLNLAAQERSADSQLLRTARNVMNPQEWSDLGAAMIRKMAYPARDAPPDRLSPDFNLATFHTNWRHLTDKAKDMLFGPNVPGSVRSGLETMSDLGRTKLLDPRTAKEGTRAIFGTAGGLGIVGEVLRRVSEMSMPSGSELAVGSAMAGTGYAISKMMVSPQFARWLYQVQARGEQMADPVGTAQRGLQEAMAAAQADRRDAREQASLRQQAYDANRSGNIADVQRFDRRRQRRLRRGLAPPIVGVTEP